METRNLIEGKKLPARYRWLFPVVAVVTLMSSCKKEEIQPEALAMDAITWTQVNMVSDQDGYGARRLDRDMVNPMGMNFSTFGQSWIVGNVTSKAMVLDMKGAPLHTPIKIGHRSTPTDVVRNMTTGFYMPNGVSARYLFSSANGTISGFVSGDSSRVLVSRPGAVYTALDINTAGPHTLLYAADFRNGRIDIFNTKWQQISSISLVDRSIPAEYAPFNLVSHGNKIYVTYALRGDINSVEPASAIGTGYVNIFTGSGELVRRMASGGRLNAPYGIAFDGSHVFVANHGDGQIHVYDSGGTYLGQIKNGNEPVAIPGIWDIAFASYTSDGQLQLFFTSGPVNGTRGLFGYLKRAESAS